MTDNLFRLDLSRLTRSDIAKIQGLRRKLRLMHRWFRCERLEAGGADGFALYSGDRGPRTYVSYQLVRQPGGSYELIDPRGDDVPLATARTIDGVIDALPEDFFYTGG